MGNIRIKIDQVVSFLIGLIFMIFLGVYLYSENQIYFAIGMTISLGLLIFIVIFHSGGLDVRKIDISDLGTKMKSPLQIMNLTSNDSGQNHTIKNPPIQDLIKEITNKMRSEANIDLNSIQVQLNTLFNDLQKQITSEKNNVSEATSKRDLGEIVEQINVEIMKKFDPIFEDLKNIKENLPKFTNLSESIKDFQKALEIWKSEQSQKLNLDQLNGETLKIIPQLNDRVEQIVKLIMDKKNQNLEGSQGQSPQEMPKPINSVIFTPDTQETPESVAVVTSVPSHLEPPKSDPSILAALNPQKTPAPVPPDKPKPYSQAKVTFEYEVGKWIKINGKFIPVHFVEKFRDTIEINGAKYTKQSNWYKQNLEDFSQVAERISKLQMIRQLIIIGDKSSLFYVYYKSKG